MLPMDHPAVVNELQRRQHQRIKQQEQARKQEEEDPQESKTKRRKKNEKEPEEEGNDHETKVVDSGKWKMTHCELAEKRQSLNKRSEF